MGASYGKKKAYSVGHEPQPRQQCVRNGMHPKVRRRGAPHMRTSRVQDQVHVEHRTGRVQDQVHVEHRTGRVQDQVHVDHRTGRVQDLVHVEQRTGRVQDLVHMEQRTGRVQDLVHVEHRTGRVQDQVHTEQRTGRVQDQVHTEQRTGRVQDQVHMEQRTGRVQDLVHTEQRTGRVQDLVHTEQRTGSSPEQSREGMVKSASAYADLQQHRSEGVHRKPSPVSSYVPQPDYLEDDEDSDLIKPKKLVNPVKASKSHQELHRELMSSCKRGGVSVEMKPELQRVLDSRKRDQLIKQRKQEEEAHRKISPLEAELIKRHKKLEELEKQQEKQQEENLKAPEFVKVKKNLRRTSLQSKEEKEV